MFLIQQLRCHAYHVRYVGRKGKSLDLLLGGCCVLDCHTTFHKPLHQSSFTSCIPLNNVYLCWPAPTPIPKLSADNPQDALDALSSSEVIQEAVSVYFNTIHKWFPFISRKRMNLGISLAGGGPDLTLLLLAIKLITITPPQSQSADKVPLYWTAKHFFQRLEVAGTASILYLQSQILIALYEYSHALYPAAYLSVGSCVRYASLLGLPSYAEVSAVLGPCKVDLSQLFTRRFRQTSVFLSSSPWHTIYGVRDDYWPGLVSSRQQPTHRLGSCCWDGKYMGLSRGSVSLFISQDTLDSTHAYRN